MFSSITITGSEGFLGRHLIKYLRAQGYQVTGLTHKALDITDSEAVLRTMSSLRPKILIHCAAISSTAYAALHPDESMAVNVRGCVNLAKACLETGTDLYVMSSDQVYGGCTTEGPLGEDILLSPNNVYGSHKLLMENKVLEIWPQAKVLRLSWMFEPFNPEKPHTDIISRLTAVREGKDVIKASTREFRGMTRVDDVCKAISDSISLIPGGVYNFGAGNPLDTFSTLASIAGSTGIPVDRIIPDDSWGRNLAMDCSKLNSFNIRFQDTVQQIVKCL